MIAEAISLPEGAHVLLLLAPAAPLLLALAAVHPRWRRAVMALAPWSALPALAVSIWVQSGAPVDLPWLLLRGSIGLDETGRVFLFFTSLLWLLSLLFATGYPLSEGRRGEFFGSSLLAMAGNFGLILAQDLILFYCFFALMSFASFPLVIHSRDREALHAGRVYIALVVLGELLLFAGFVSAASDTGSLLFRDVAAPEEGLGLALLLAGFGIKAGAIPLHVWLPLAHPAAPVPASAVLSGAMIKAGLIGWLRILPLGHAALPEWSTLCILAGLTAAFYGALAGVAQDNPKTVLAYSSISQMGLMTIGVGLGLSDPAIWKTAGPAVALYALHHGLAKGALFLGVGIAHAARSRRATSLTRAALLLAAAALAGAPWTSGAVAKAGLKEAVYLASAPWPNWLGALLSIAAAGTTLLMIRFLWLIWSEQPAPDEKLTPLLWMPWSALVAAVALAVWPWIKQQAWIAEALDPSGAPSALLPIAAGGLIAYVARRALRGREIPRLLRIPPGDLLSGVLWLGQRVSRVWRTGTPVRLAAPARSWFSGRKSSWVREAASNLASTMEWALADWTVVGSGILLLLLALLAALRV